MAHVRFMDRSRLLMTRRHVVASFATLTAALAVPGRARADVAEISALDGVAIRGADPVAYFARDGFVPGKREHALLWRGALWLFAQAGSMAAFELDPLAFSPQFGGYCALAMGHGVISQGDPRAFLVQDGALYLCSSPLAMARFREDVPRNVLAARANWPAILGG